MSVDSGTENYVSIFQLFLGINDGSNPQGILGDEFVT